mgnify:FL=1
MIDVCSTLAATIKDEEPPRHIHTYPPRLDPIDQPYDPSRLQLPSTQETAVFPPSIKPEAIHPNDGFPRLFRILLSFRSAAEGFPDDKSGRSGVRGTPWEE